MVEAIRQGMGENCLAYQKLRRNNTISPLLARRLREYSVGQIVDKVAQERGLSSEEILGTSRRKDIAQARQEAQYVIFYAFPVSLRLTAMCVGRSDHTTAMNSIKRIEDLRSQDPDYSQYLDRLLGEFKPSL